MGENTTKHKTFDEELVGGKESKSSYIKFKFADFGKDGGNVIRPFKIKWEVNSKELQFLCLGDKGPIIYLLWAVNFFEQFQLCSDLFPNDSLKALTTTKLLVSYSSFCLLQLKWISCYYFEVVIFWSCLSLQHHSSEKYKVCNADGYRFGFHLVF